MSSSLPWLFIGVFGIIVIVMLFQPDLFSGWNTVQKPKPVVAVPPSQKKVSTQRVRIHAPKHKNNEKKVKKGNDQQDSVTSAWDGMLTAKELLPQKNNEWEKYGCNTFVPQTNDLLSSVATPSRIATMFPKTNPRAMRNRDLRGSIQVPIDKTIEHSMLLAKPDGYGVPFEDPRHIEMH